MHSETPLSPEVWERLPPEVQVYIRALEARVGALEETVQQLEATVHQVREQLQQNSRTSSRPPSSDPPQVLSQRPRREPSGRRPGGQPGHEGQTRALLPVEEVEAVIPVKPERCPRCQHSLVGADPQPQRHQVTELAPVKPVVTEYQRHRLVCPGCGEATRAAVPAGVPAGGFGPRAQGRHRLHPRAEASAGDPYRHLRPGHLATCRPDQAV
jgi:transposase